MMMVSHVDDVMLITTEGVIIRIHAADISTIGRNTSGVRLMRTTENNLIVSCARTDREEDADDADGAEDGDEPQNGGEELDGQSGGKSDASDEEPDLEAGREILNKLDIE